MNFKSRNFVLSIILIILIQVLLFTNNTQKISFRYFIWTLQEVSIGKLINFSFFSGLVISFFLNNMNYLELSNKNKNFSKNEENYDPKELDEDYESNIDLPPQRDVRDTQPTISVNYRIIKSNQEDDERYKQDNSDNSGYKDDWINDDDDW